MRFLLGIFTGLWAELRATFGVWALLRRRFWVAYILLLLATLSVPFLPGAYAPIGAGIMVLGLGFGAIFSGMAAKRVRRAGWVLIPDGPEVVPYLSQAIAILLGPPFFLAMAALFQSLSPYLPGLHAEDWTNALRLALDNVLYTAIFFDFFEAFHLRAGPKPTGFAAASLIFVVRTLLDIAFIKLTVQLVRAAYFRSLNFGRGGDLIAQTQEACINEDLSAARLHSRDVGQSVRAAADDLRAHVEAGGPEAEQAWLGLRAMKAYAIAHFEDRAETQLGEERARTQGIIERLKADDGPEPEPKPVSVGGVILLAIGYALLTALTYVAWFVTASTSWPLSVGLALLQGWFLIRPRWWLDRLDAWGILPSAKPTGLPLRILVWLFFLTPLFIVNASEVVWLLGQASPSSFGAKLAAEVTPPAAFEFVVENLLRAQIFVDTVEIYNLTIFNLVQNGFLGSLVTFLLRLVFNIGLLAVLVPFLLERFNQWFRSVKTRPDAELLLRREARSCSPHSALLVAYYFSQVRDWFVEAMNRNRDRSALLGALAASGFIRDFQESYPDGPTPDADPTVAITHRLERGNALIEQGLLAESEQEIRRAVAQLEQLRASGRIDLDALTAIARNVQANLAMTHTRNAEAEGYLREAYALAVQVGGGETGNPHSAFLADVLDSMAIVIGTSVARAHEAFDCSQRSVDLYEQLVSQGRADLRHQLAAALGTRGQMLNLLQRWDDSVASLKRALTILTEVQAENDKAVGEALGLFGGTTATRIDVRGSLAQRRLELAEVYRELRRFADSAAEARQAVELLDILVREGQSGVRDQLVRALNTQGLSLNDDGKPDEARTAYDRARQLCEQLILEGHGNQRRLLGPVLNNLGTLLLAKGQVVESEQRFRRAVEIIEGMVGEGQAQREELLVFVYSNLGQALMRQKKMHEAEVEIARGVEIGRKLVNAGQTTLRDELALVLSNLGDLLTLKYQWEDAVAAFRECAGWYDQLVSGGAEQYRILRARALDRLSRSLREFGDVEQAIIEGRNAVAEFALLLRAGRTEYRLEQVYAIRTLGLAHQVNRQFDEAYARFAEAEKLLDSPSAEDRTARSWLLVDTARTHEGQEQFREAIRILDRAIMLQSQLVDAGQKDLQADLGMLLNHRGDLLFNEGDTESSLTAYREGVRRLQPLVDAGRKDLRDSLSRVLLNCGAAMAKLNEQGWAEPFQSGLNLVSTLVAEGDPGAADEYSTYTDTFTYLLRGCGRLAEAEPVLRHTAAVYATAAADPRNHRARLGEARTRYALALLQAELGNQAEFQTEAGTTLTLLEEMLQLPEPPDRALRQYREALAGLGRVLSEKGDAQSALAMAARALSFLENRHHQGQPGLTRLLVETLERNAEIQRTCGQTDEAIALLQRAEEFLPADPFDAYSPTGPAWRRHQLLIQSGQRSEAAALAQQALDTLSETTDPLAGSDARTVALWQQSLGVLFHGDGDSERAVPLLRQSVALLQTAGAEAVESVRVLTDLLGASQAVADRALALDILQRLGDPVDATPETAVAARELIARARQQSDDATWQTLQTTWQDAS